MKTFIGIDNGVTGSIGIITPEEEYFYKTPVKKEQNYTKKKGLITRIDVQKLGGILSYKNVLVSIERPMVNPARYAATLSAIRALEATISFLESKLIGFSYIDSKEWQRELLPYGVKGASELKKASKDIGIRMFPQFKETINSIGDADGILIAEFLKRKYI